MQMLDRKVGAQQGAKQIFSLSTLQALALCIQDSSLTLPVKRKVTRVLLSRFSQEIERNRLTRHSKFLNHYNQALMESQEFTMRLLKTSINLTNRHLEDWRELQPRTRLLGDE